MATMLRNGAVRGIPQALRPTTFTPRLKARSASTRPCLCSVSRPVSNKLSMSLYKPAPNALLRYASTATPGDHIDFKREAKIGEKVMRAHPERVSSESTVHPLTHEVATKDEEEDVDMMAGIKQDLKTIQNTFTLEEIPRNALYLGAAGVLPYLATSLSTVYLAWDLNHSATHGVGVLLDAQTALLGLQILEPLQIGYGAVIISFLGAIHWGMEWANYGPPQNPGHSFTRYKLGVVAPAIAWPTILMPVEYALISQFLAFIYLYFQDARASARGFAPPWYGTYRFMLTFVVGASLVVSLIGRGEIVEYTGHPSRPSDKLKALRESQMMYLEKEEEERQRRIAEEDEEGGSEDEEKEESSDEEE